MKDFFKDNTFLKNLFVLVVFILTVFAIYYPALYSAPLWDDWVFIFKSNTLKKAQVLDFWKWGEYRRSWPVYYSTISLMFKSWGSQFFNYHLCSVVIHALNGWLIWKIIKQLKGNYGVWIALIYLVHPLNFYTIAWIIQFKTVLSIFFFLLSLKFFIESESKKLSIVHYVLSVLFFGLSLFTKSAFAPMLVIMLFYKNKKKMIPYIMLCVYSILLTLWSTHIKEYIANYDLFPVVVAQDSNYQYTPMRPTVLDHNIQFEDPYVGIPLTFTNLAKYTAYIFYPWDNLLVHPRTLVSRSYLQIIGALFIILIFTYVYIKCWEDKNTLGLVGISFFLITIIPLSGMFFVPIFHYSNFVEYWLSVPVLGVLLLLSTVKPHRAILGLLIFLTLFFSYKTFQSSRETPESVSMITKSAIASPENDLIEMILAKHYFYMRQFISSNKVLLKLRKSSNLDKDKIEHEMSINTKAMLGEEINETTL